MEQSQLSSQLGSQEQEDNLSWNKLPFSQSCQSKSRIITEMLRRLLQIYRELNLIQLQKDLNTNKIARAVEKGLSVLYKIDGRSFIEKGKEMFQICQNLAFQADWLENESIKYLPSQYKEESKAASKVRKPKQQIKDEVYQQKAIKFANQQKGEQRLQKAAKREPRAYFEKQQVAMIKSKQPQRQNPSEQQKEKKPYQFVGKQQYLNSPYAYENSTDEGDQKAKSMASQLLQPNHINQYHSLDVPSLLDTKQRSGMQISGKQIKKVSETSQYQCLFAKESLSLGKIYKIKFRVVKLGTLAIGLVSSVFKKQKCVDDRQRITAVKYVAFESGNGRIKLCGETKMIGEQVGLKNNATLQMIFNSQTMRVTFAAAGIFNIDLPAQFQQYPLYLFLEMKNQQTCIQFL